MQAFELLPKHQPWHVNFKRTHTTFCPQSFFDDLKIGGWKKLPQWRPCKLDCLHSFTSFFFVGCLSSESVHLSEHVGQSETPPCFLPRGEFPSSFRWNSAIEAPLRHAFTSECCSQGCFWPANRPILIQMRARCRFMPAIMEVLEAGRISHRGECWSAGWQFAMRRLLKWKYSLCIGECSCPCVLPW